jgi:hypothetical protein
MEAVCAIAAPPFADSAGGRIVAPTYEMASEQDRAMHVGSVIAHEPGLVDSGRQRK